jgi:hypothetical protein
MLGCLLLKMQTSTGNCTSQYVWLPYNLFLTNFLIMRGVIRRGACIPSPPGEAVPDCTDCTEYGVLIFDGSFLRWTLLVIATLILFIDCLAIFLLPPILLRLLPRSLLNFDHPRFICMPCHLPSWPLHTWSLRLFCLHTSRSLVWPSTSVYDDQTLPHA